MAEPASIGAAIVLVASFSFGAAPAGNPAAPTTLAPMPQAPAQMALPSPTVPTQSSALPPVGTPVIGARGAGGIVIGHSGSTALVAPVGGGPPALLTPNGNGTATLFQPGTAP